MFDICFDRLIGIEGRYSNHKADKGGETMYGITLKVARANGYHDSMREMPVEVAKNIYRLKYWDLNSLDDIARIDDQIAFELFESGVNVGIKKATKWLQKCINITNETLAVDGIIGVKTLAALKSRNKKQLKSIYTFMNAYQCYHYVSIIDKNETQNIFFQGWLKRVDL